MTLNLPLLLCFTLVLAAAAPAQQPTVTGSQAEGYGLRVSTKLVSLDVVVTNKHGDPVPGLTADDFQVYESGVLQHIQAFEASTAATAVLPSVDIHSTAELDRLAPQVPVNIIVLDEVMLQFQDEAFARYALEKYLASEGDKLALPTLLMAVSPQHQLILRDYTTSRKEILDALNHHLSKSNWDAKNPYWSSRLFMASIASLIGVANATAGHPGHKNIVWVGRGFPDMPWNQMAPVLEKQFHEALDLCTNRLRDSRVTLYRVDPAGVAAGLPVDHADAEALENGTPEDIQIADPFGDQADFDALAHATGGRALYGRNDVDRMIEQVVRDGRSFYTLTYRPSGESSSPAAFRPIRVVTKNRALMASTRVGYFAEGVKDSTEASLSGIVPHPSTFDLGVAADGLMIYDAVPLTIEPSTSSPDKPGQFRITFPARAVTWAPKGGRFACNVTVLLTSYDAKGVRLHREGRVIELPATTAPDPSDSAAPRAIHILLSTPLTPAPSRLRVLVQDNATGKIGSANYSLTAHAMIGDATTSPKGSR